MSEKDKINVLLVDDHEVVRAGYRRLLEGTDDIAVIAEEEDGESAYTGFFQYHPDVLVMDLSMPGIGGLEASRLRDGGEEFSPSWCARSPPHQVRHAADRRQTSASQDLTVS